MFWTIRFGLNILAHVLSDEPGPKIVDITGGKTGDNSNRLALEK
jgi:hypothetical protein